LRALALGIGIAAGGEEQHGGDAGERDAGG
jgi:hypothetical protein